MNHPSPSISLRPPDPADYDTDFVLWIERQVVLLRAKQFEQVDLENVIEELEAMGGNNRRELQSRLKVLITHLLKCEFQPERRSRSWLGTLRTQRSEIRLLLEQSPSLAHDLAAYADKVFPSAVGIASAETGLDEKIFPEANPYSLDSILDDNFVP